MGKIFKHLAFTIDRVSGCQAAGYLRDLVRDDLVTKLILVSSLDEEYSVKNKVMDSMGT